VRRALTALLLAWLAAVVVIAITREASGVPHLAGLASTPDLIAHGRLWTLLTSALPVSRYPILEIPGLLAAIYGVWRLAGLGAVWTAALAAHIGATLVVYGAVGGLWLADRGAVDRFVDRLDYGISAVWLGELGLLTALLWNRNRRAAIGVGGASIAVSAALLPFAGEIASAEHFLALAIGWLLPRTLPHATFLHPPAVTPSRPAA
jgi:hypothetical protein